MAVGIDTEPRLRAGTPSALFSGRYRSGGLTNPIPYDVSPDGQQFLVIKDLQPGDTAFGQAEIVVIENWAEELKRLVPID